MGGKALAFFPWWDAERPFELDSLRLLPYKYRSLPGDLGLSTQKEIDGVLGAYRNRPKERIKKGTLLEIEGWTSGSDPEDFFPAMFAARELVAFSALSERQLFNRSCSYCCFDTFTLVVQRYDPAAIGRFAYSTRRRDGSVTNIWTADEFSFLRPLHVLESDRAVLDQRLLRMLLLSAKPHWLDAIVDFNRANTDSNDVSPHVELIMMKSAFESLLRIDEKRSSLEAALVGALSGIDPVKNLTGALSGKWKMRGRSGDRPLVAWVYDFCDRRGSAAHGAQRSHSRFAWSEASHLAFASKLFPLLLKKIACDDGLFDLSGRDVEALRRIDQYVLSDPFGPMKSCGEKHPWGQIEKEILLSAM